VEAKKEESDPASMWGEAKRKLHLRSGLGTRMGKRRRVEGNAKCAGDGGLCRKGVRGRAGEKKAGQEREPGKEGATGQRSKTVGGQGARLQSEKGEGVKYHSRGGGGVVVRWVKTHIRHTVRRIRMGGGRTYQQGGWRKTWRNGGVSAPKTHNATRIKRRKKQSRRS